MLPDLPAIQAICCSPQTSQQSQFGLVLGTRRFGEIVGRDRVAQILGDSASFDAAKALEIGFVHRVAPPEEWEEVVADARRTAASLDDADRAALYGTLASDRPDTDLATLVRSAARPGLKDRVARYLSAG